LSARRWISPARRCLLTAVLTALGDHVELRESMFGWCAEFDR
jgi:hypothetical protein